MAYAAARSIAGQIESLFEGSAVAGMADRELLERFTASNDAAGDAAFAALGTRHGPIVLHVCRQLLGDRHLAEDAFQAVFLVLARKALSIRDPDLLGAWLHGVAIRTARKAKARLDRRRRNECNDAMRRPGWRSSLPVELATQPAEESALSRERAEALHEEIDCLPHAFRLAVVLCYFEGLTLDEAANRLRWPVGTLRSRLARARDKLRRGLSRRGVVLSGTALTAALASRSAAGSVASPLCDMTTRAAIRFAAGPAAGEALAASTTALAQDVLRSMLIPGLRLAALFVLFLGALAAGVGNLIPLLHGSAQSREGEARSKAHRNEPPPPDPPRPAPGRMLVVGTVLDLQGKPVPNASVTISLRRKLLFSGPGSEGGFPAAVGHGASDASGRFRLDAPRAGSAHHAKFGATALAPGYGVGWSDLDPDLDQPSTEIRLMPEQVIEGRLFDVDGQPVAGVVVSVSAIWRALPPIRLAQGQVVEDRSEGPVRWWARVNDLGGWPKPTTTDADGRFTLHGVGRGLNARLSVLDPRFAPQTIEIATDAPTEFKTRKAALQPARTVTGRVTYADTGKPVAHAAVRVDAGSGRAVTADADAEGRLKVGTPPGPRVVVSAKPPDGQPYLGAAKSLDWPRGATEQVVDLALPRGVLIRGMVTEEGTGRPVADAMVSFNPHAQRLARTDASGWALTKADGSFKFAVGPHPGHLSIQAPGEDYQLQVIGISQLSGGQGGGPRLYAHALLPCDPKPGTEPLEIRVALRRGTTVKVRLIGPDGQPARDVWVYSRAVLGPTAVSAMRGWAGDSHDIALHGHFEVHGLDTETEVPVHFLQPQLKLGATVRLSGKMAAQGPVTVRLEPCGLAMARLAGPDGKPVTGQPRGVSIPMVVTPGPPSRSAEVRAGALAADEDLLGRVDPVNHGNGWVADVQGRIALPCLIPGATYRIIARGGGGGPQIRREFVVGPGETLELGDVLIQKPPG